MNLQVMKASDRTPMIKLVHSVRDQVERAVNQRVKMVPGLVKLARRPRLLDAKSRTGRLKRHLGNDEKPKSRM